MTHYPVIVCTKRSSG